SSRRSMACAFRSAAVRCRPAHRSASPSSTPIRKCAARSNRPTARCMCARRSAATKPAAPARNEMDGIVLAEDLPTAAEYREFRARAGWGAIDEATAQRTIGAACYTVTLRRQGKLIGLARVMGDGALYFFLADLIVDPELRGEGLGGRLMRAVSDYFDRCAKPGATIALIPLRGGEAF